MLFVACKHTKVISTSPTSQKTIINSTNSNSDVKALELIAKIQKEMEPQGLVDEIEANGM